MTAPTETASPATAATTAPADTTATDDTPAAATPPPQRHPEGREPGSFRLTDPGPRPFTRLRALLGAGLTGPRGVALAALVAAPGLLVDHWLRGSFGMASSLTFVLAASLTAVAVRRGALGTAAVLPPLLFAAMVATLSWASGNNHGRRQLVLDVGTTLAVSAPVLFVGTAAALAVVAGRVVVHLVRR